MASLYISCIIVINCASLVSAMLTAFIIAIALKPIATFLEKLYFGRLLSSITTVSLFLLFFCLLTFFFSAQLQAIKFDFPQGLPKIENSLIKAKSQLEHFSGISAEQIKDLTQNSFANIFSKGTLFLKNTLSVTASFSVAFLIFLISLFFIIYYRLFLVQFLYQIFNKANHQQLHKILEEIPKCVFNYVYGLLLIIIIIAVLNSLGLLILGLKHAIFFGCLAACLTLVPYFGILIGSIIPAIYAYQTTNSWFTPLLVIGIFLIVQLLEGYILTPNIIGKQISVNPFAAIISMLLFSALLGIMGIILALPTLAILKIIFSNVSQLKPLAFVLGNPKIAFKK